MRLRLIRGGDAPLEGTVRTWAAGGRVTIDYTMGDRYSLSPDAARRLAAALLMAAEHADPSRRPKPDAPIPTN